MGPSDEELVRQYQFGDDGAFAVLVDRYASSAVRFAAHLVRGVHEGEDVAQDAFLKLVPLLRAGGFDPLRGRFAPFFFRMLRNLAIDRIRARVPSLGLDAEPPTAADAAPSASLELAERRDRVRALVARLPESERTAIVLREYEGLSYKEIAAALDTPLDTVKTWIFRARRRIQDAWLALEVERDPL